MAAAAKLVDVSRDILDVSIVLPDPKERELVREFSSLRRCRSNWNDLRARFAAMGDRHLFPTFHGVQNALGMQTEIFSAGFHWFEVNTMKYILRAYGRQWLERQLGAVAIPLEDG
jgi:hypothetical protein